MRVRILRVETGEHVNATIERNSRGPLPSLHDEGWRFNFARLTRRLENAFTYVLVTEETPHIIEGCLIFQLIDGEIPYGAYLEVSPHNKGNEKKYDHVAGCLIAFAYGLSVRYGKGPFKGQLYFDVMEENEGDEKKLKDNYISRYGAEELYGTKLKIAEKNGQALIEKYLGWDLDSSKF